MDLLKVNLLICAVFLFAACAPFDNPSLEQDNNVTPDNPELATSPSGSGTTSFEINTRNDTDEVKVLQEGDMTLFEIRSPSGIGGARVEVTEGKLTAPAALRILLGALENLIVAYEDVTLTLSVSSADPELVLRSVQIGSGSPQDIQPDSPYWMEVVVDKDPLNQELIFVVSLPAAMFQVEPTEFEISWIDFYR